MILYGYCRGCSAGIRRRTEGGQLAQRLCDVCWTLRTADEDRTSRPANRPAPSTRDKRERGKGGRSYTARDARTGEVFRYVLGRNESYRPMPYDAGQPLVVVSGRSWMPQGTTLGGSGGHDGRDRVRSRSIGEATAAGRFVQPEQAAISAENERERLERAERRHRNRRKGQVGGMSPEAIRRTVAVNAGR